MASTTVETGRSGTRALRRILRHHVGKAARALRARRAPESAIHQARKEIKKSRAAVRLLRSALGERDYQRENATLRDAGRGLNALRDARVRVQTLQGLRLQNRQLGREAGVLALSRVLHTEHRQLLRRLAAHPSSLVPVRRSLQQLERRATRWKVGRHGWSVLGPGIRRIYRSGRRALPPLQPRASDPALHEWRKQAKYLRYALRMLAPMDSRMLEPLAHQAERLTAYLGQAHDLAVLADKVAASTPARRDLALLLRVIDREHQYLTGRALSIGEQLYRLRPGQFDRQLGRSWRRWRRGGRTAERRLPESPDASARSP